MRSQWLEAGRIVATHGVHGEVKVQPWADDPSFLLNFDKVLLRNRPVAVEQARVHKSQVLLKLAGIDTMEAAAALRGQILSIDRSDAALDADTVFIADLIGLPVFADGAEIGKITEVLSLPANDVYVVKTDSGKEVLLPAIRQCILDTDLEAGRITVHILDGLLDL